MEGKNRIPFFQYMNGYKGIDIAEKSGLSPGTVSIAIRRNKATPRTQEKIAQVFGVTVDEIFPNVGAEEN